MNLIRNTAKAAILLSVTGLLFSCGQGDEQQTEQQTSGGSQITSEMIKEGSSEEEIREKRDIEVREGEADFTPAERTLNFGEVAGGTEASEQITFKNTGEEPLEIFEVMVENEAFKVEYPAEPVEPGDEGLLRIDFDSENLASGDFRNAVRLLANTPSGRAALRVEGNVVGGVTGDQDQLALGGVGNENTDQYGRPPGHDHYGHDHPPRDGAGQQQAQRQPDASAQNQHEEGETDEYGRPPGHDHYGHDHPPLEDQDQQIEMNQTDQQTEQADQEGETDEYGRPPGHDHYGHDHPPLEDQDQQIEMDQMADEQEGETDEYGRSPDHDHYGHNHPPRDQQEQGDTQVDQQDQQEGGAEFDFEKTEHDFGTLQDDIEVNHQFEFTNTGEEPLVIENVRAGCGCTAPSYSREPVQPGETGYVEVAYDTGYRDVETFNQSVTIEANTPSPERVTVTGAIE